MKGPLEDNEIHLSCKLWNQLPPLPHGRGTEQAQNNLIWYHDPQGLALDGRRTPHQQKPSANVSRMRRT